MDFRNITKIARNLTLYKNKSVKFDLNENELEITRYLSKHKEGLTQNELALYLNVDKALVSRMIKKLLQKDYVTVKKDALDSRKNIIKPTLKSINLKQENINEEITYYNMITQGLSREEKLLLYDLIEKIYLESKRFRKNKFEA